MEHSHHFEHAGILPLWLRLAWVATFGAVAIVHLYHARVLTGQHRYWHIGHVVMACGMFHMYLPPTAQLLGPGAGIAVFTVAAFAAIFSGVWMRLRTGTFNLLWALTTIEMAVMVYMFLPGSARSPVISAVLAGYLAVVGVLWALGRWNRLYLVHPSATGPALAVRASLTAMTAGMAYMLVSM